MTEYHANTLSADVKYKGKLLRLSGEALGAKARDDGKGYYLPMVSFVGPDGGAGSNVFCLIATSEEAQFAKVQGYDRVEVVARLVGRREQPGAFGGFVVILEDAHLVSPPKR